MNFSRFSAFSAITGPAERKNSLQMRRFQTISEFSHGLDPFRTKRGTRTAQPADPFGVGVPLKITAVPMSCTGPTRSGRESSLRAEGSTPSP
jgi:hypothetical protein